MFEFEVKLQLKSFHTGYAWFKSKCHDQKGKIKQSDTIFIRSETNFLNSKSGDEFVRIRESNGAKILNRKKQLENELSNLEFECIVHPNSNIREIIETLGYIEVVQVEKVRYEGKHNGYNVCLDRVSGLGDFIEFELLTDQSINYLDFQKEVLLLLSNNGVEIDRTVDKGYDTMIYLNKQENIRT